MPFYTTAEYTIEELHFSVPLYMTADYTITIDVIAFIFNFTFSKIFFVVKLLWMKADEKRTGHWDKMLLDNIIFT